MGAQAGSYSDEQLRLLAAFITRMPKLPPGILAVIQQKPEASTKPAEPKK